MENRSGFRNKLYEIIFEADTPAGKAFDVILLIAILLSVVVVILGSEPSLAAKYGDVFYFIEWFLTILFTIEYFLRIYTVEKPMKYIFSFYGIIDFIAIIPTYLAVFLTGSHFLVVIRVLRLMRVFRVLKLARYIKAGDTLSTALKNSRGKIIVFLEAVVMLVIIIGSLMYLVEGPENGFTSILVSIYWAIVTVTTVGYGDIAPQTVTGQAIAAVLMIVGYAIIAVPTGIITSEVSSARKKTNTNTQVCQNCLYDQHDDDAKYCKMCGNKLR
jgi:voltage-gated potassium channel